MRESAAEDAPVSFATEAVLGLQTVAILKASTHVEAFRINPRRGNIQPLHSIGGYNMIAQRAVNDEFAAKLRTALLYPGSYSGRKHRCFEPGVGFRIWREKEAVDVVLCFRCTNLKIGIMGEKGTLRGFGGTTETVWIDLAKEAFPDDADIQALTPTK